MAGGKVEETTGDSGRLRYGGRHALPYETAWFTAVHREAVSFKRLDVVHDLDPRRHAAQPQARRAARLAAKVSP
jgi:hypothetical protein